MRAVIKTARSCMEDDDDEGGENAIFVFPKP